MIGSPCGQRCSTSRTPPSTYPHVGQIRWTPLGVPVKIHVHPTKQPQRASLFKYMTRIIAVLLMLLAWIVLSRLACVLFSRRRTRERESLPVSAEKPASPRGSVLTDVPPHAPPRAFADIADFGFLRCHEFEARGFLNPDKYKPGAHLVCSWKLS